MNPHFRTQYITWLIATACLIIVLLSSLSGCATLAPDYLKPEVAHISHLTQHRPFTDHPTNYGSEAVGVLVGWQRQVVEGNGATAFLEIGEAYNVERLDGMHEEFSARAGFIIPLK
jgi:hypothetical protein